MPTQRQLFLEHVAQTSPKPLMLEIEKAEGIFLFDKNGKQYMDMISGISVSSLGHCHPAVVKAIQAQSEKYMHLMVYGEYVYSPQVELASYLCNLLPETLNSAYFVNSGAEATEGAMKLAKRYTGRSEIIYFRKSYHGSSQGALSIMGDEYFKQAYRPLLPDCKMLNYGQYEDLQEISDHTAAVFIEPVQAESGVTVPNEAYLHNIRKKCSDMGALLVFDEIQTGCGRTGSLFAFEQTGVVPDVLLLAKALGAGLPIGAFITDKKIMQSLTENPVLGHITTFGGNPVSCAAALAGLKVLNKERPFERVTQLEKLFKERLQHPHIKAFRSKGLLMAVEFENEAFNQRVIQNCISAGLITDWFLFAPHCLRLAPPLIISEEQVDEACKIILDATEKAVN